MISAVSSLDESNDKAAVWNKNVVHSMLSDLHHVLHASIGFNLPCKAHLLSHLTKHGVTYTVWSQHAGNSCVLVGSEGGTVAAPACIEHIVQFPALEEISTFIGI
jgi:hypothetical protein